MGGGIKNNNNRLNTKPQTRKKVAGYYILFLVFIFICIKYDCEEGIELLITRPPTQHFKSNRTDLLHNGQNYFNPDFRDIDTILHPLGDNSVSVSLKPSMGSHRREADAVFASAEEISYEDIALFVTSLRSSGFEGDIVVSVSKRQDMEPGIFEFLKFHSERGLVVYEAVMVVNTTLPDEANLSLDENNITTDGTDKDHNEEVKPTLFVRRDEMNPQEEEMLIEHCLTNAVQTNIANESIPVLENKMLIREKNVTLFGLYVDAKSGNLLSDPRDPRPSTIARFELFWIWSKKYRRNSKIMISDAYESYFQRHPFLDLVAERKDMFNYESTHDSNQSISGDLHLYVEDLKIPSSFSSTDEAYGRAIYLSLSRLEVLIAGATHGHQDAIESYLRNIVKQYDITKCKVPSCEDSMTSYLYYFGILKRIQNIQNIFLHSPKASGNVRSISYINNCKLSEKELSDGNVREVRWIGNTSIDLGEIPVLYKFKCNSFLSERAMTRAREIVNETDFTATHKKTLLDWDKLPNPTKFVAKKSNVDSVVVSFDPHMGFHRPNMDAVFSHVEDPSTNGIVVFISSLRETGFIGDIVLSIPDIDESIEKNLLEFLEYHCNHGLIVYTGKISAYYEQLYKIYAPDFDADYYLEDKRDERIVEIIRFELYWAIVTKYEPASEILLIESDYTFFQRNPFADMEPFDATNNKGIIHFFGENKASRYHKSMFIHNRMKWREAQAMLPLEFAQKLKIEHNFFAPNFTVYSPGALLGHQHGLETYLRAIILMVDESGCVDKGCDYAILNFLWHFDLKVGGYPSNFVPKVHYQGGSFVNTLGFTSFQKMNESRVFNDGLVLNFDLNVSHVVMHMDLYDELRQLFDSRAAKYISAFERIVKDAKR